MTSHCDKTPTLVMQSVRMWWWRQRWGTTTGFPLTKQMVEGRRRLYSKHWLQFWTTGKTLTSSTWKLKSEESLVHTQPLWKQAKLVCNCVHMVWLAPGKQGGSHLAFSALVVLGNILLSSSQWRWKRVKGVWIIYVLPEQISSKQESFWCQAHSSKRIVSPSIDIFITVAHIVMKLSCILASCPALCGLGAGVWLDMYFLS